MTTTITTDEFPDREAVQRALDDLVKQLREASDKVSHIEWISLSEVADTLESQAKQLEDLGNERTELLDDISYHKAKLDNVLRRLASAREVITFYQAYAETAHRLNGGEKNEMCSDFLARQWLTDNKAEGEGR